MGLILFSILLLFILLFNLYNHYNKVISKKNFIEKRINYTSWIQYFLFILGAISIPFCFYSFSKEHNFNLIFYCIILAIFIIAYITLSRQLYCFKEYMIIGLNKKIKYSDINKIEFSDNKNNRLSITFSTTYSFITISIPKKAKDDFLSYMYKKTPKKIFSL